MVHATARAFSSGQDLLVEYADVDDAIDTFHLTQQLRRHRGGDIDQVIGDVAAAFVDHVDNIEKTAQEVRRVLKPSGRFRMHVHYHPPTMPEPLDLNDENVCWYRLERVA